MNTMGHFPQSMCEIHSIGLHTKERIVGGRAAPVCARFGIGLAGVSEARHGFAWTRLNSVATQFMATVRGTGEVFLNGRWTTAKAGSAFVMPAGVPHAYRATRKNFWLVCWVSYDRCPPEIADLLPRVPSSFPLPCAQLWHAIEGACASISSGATAVQVDSWVRIIHEIVLQASKTDLSDRRLHRLWELVDQDLSRPWSLQELARVAGVNKETLRRMCLRIYRKSPMHYVIRLRMERAAELISGSSDKLSSVAERVGYRDAFSFSAAFKREKGVPPSACRSGFVR